MAEYDEDELIVNVMNQDVDSGLTIEAFMLFDDYDLVQFGAMDKDKADRGYGVDHEQYAIAIREVLKRALKPVFTKMNDMQAEIYDLRQDLADAKSDLRDYKLQLEDAQRQMWDNS
jgi:flagellar capping protein FliD